MGAPGATGIPDDDPGGPSIGGIGGPGFGRKPGRCTLNLGATLGTGGAGAACRFGFDLRIAGSSAPSAFTRRVRKSPAFLRLRISKRRSSTMVITAILMISKTKRITLRPSVEAQYQFSSCRPLGANLMPYINTTKTETMVKAAQAMYGSSVAVLKTHPGVGVPRAPSSARSCRSCSRLTRSM